MVRAIQQPVGDDHGATVKGTGQPAFAVNVRGKKRFTRFGYHKTVAVPTNAKSSPWYRLHFLGASVHPPQCDGGRVLPSRLVGSLAPPNCTTTKKLVGKRTVAA